MKKLLVSLLSAFLCISVVAETGESAIGYASIPLKYRVTSDSTAVVIYDYSYKKLKSVVIPSEIRVDGHVYSVTSVGEGTFRYCCELTSIEIPSSVTSIKAYAFSGCSGLTSIEIPTSVTEIGDHAFFGCTGLTNGEIHSPEIEFGIRVLCECENLKSIKVPAKKADYYKKRLPEELHDLIVEMEPKKKTKKK